MIGAIIGDIVGSRYEFNNHKDKKFKLFTPECFFTDDTVMTCAVAEALLTKKDNETLQAASIRTMHEIGKKYPNCGYGHYFYNWIMDGKTEPYNSLGNGSGMRISPVAFAYNNTAEALDAAKAVTEVSHNHWEGIKGAQAVTEIMMMAKNKASFEDIRKMVNDKYYKLDFTCDEIRPTYEFNETCMGSVPQAIEAFLESESFEDAIRTAVSIGGDSDTIACMTGGMAEAYWGVPEKFRKQAVKYLDDRLYDIITRFEAKYQDVEIPDSEPDSEA